MARFHMSSLFMCVSGDTCMPTSSVFIHYSVYCAGQKEYYQATPHDGGHLSSTTTSDTFPEGTNVYVSYVCGEIPEQTHCN